MSRVLILTSSYPRWSGDFAGNFVHNLGRSLQTKKHRVFVLAPHAHGLPLQEAIDGITIRRFRYFFPEKLQRLCYGGGIPPNIQSGIIPKIQLLSFTVIQLIVAIFLVRKYHIEVINSHWLAPQGLNGSIIRKIFRVRHVLTAHSAGIQTLSRWKEFSGPLIRFILNGSDHIFTVSHFNRKLLENSGISPYKIDVLPMGVDTSLFSPDDTNYQIWDKSKIEIRLLFIGRLVYLKGVHVLLEALVGLTKSYKKISLNIVGHGPERNQLHKYCRNQNLNGVRFVGLITKPQELLEFYRSSHAIVVPSIFDREGRTEGMPVVVLEALACGKPVLCSKVGGIPDIVREGENGFLFEPGNISSLRETLIRFFELSPEQYNRLSKHARDTALCYDWKVIAAQYHSVIEALWRGKF
jgi:glycosyltransferase involved in cell wall biosynthesis